MLVGSSAGALNAASLAADADQVTAWLVEQWRRLRLGDVFCSIAGAQAPWTIARYAGEILGLPGVRLPGLLDPAPLRNSVHRLIDFPALHRNVHSGMLDCLAVCASPAANPRNTVLADRDADLPDDR